MRELSDVEAAWLGGWLCADGSILPGPPPKIRWVITDQDVLVRVAETVGVNTVHGPTPPSGLGKLPRYEWSVSGRKALELGERLRPWLSMRYAARLDEANKRWQPASRGRVLTEDNIAEIREQLLTGGHGTGRMLARRFGVSDGMISAVKHGRAWKAGDAA